MIISQTPCRLSLFGGGTDFKDYWQKDSGAVLSFTIDKYVYVVVKKSHDQLIHLSHYAKEVVSNVNDIEHDIIRECLRFSKVTENIEIIVFSDIPNAGSGLGSSSSLTVGLLNALYTYKGETATVQQLAEDACRIEIDILGQPIGIQDQYIAAYGGIRFTEFLPDGRVCTNKIDIDNSIVENLNRHLSLFYTGINRQANTILCEQKSNIEEKRLVLDEIRDQAWEGRKLLSNNDMQGLGKLLSEGWLKKRELCSKISNPLLDKTIEEIYAAKAYGCKIAGAGGGGFILVISSPESKSLLTSNLSELVPYDAVSVDKGTEVIYNDYK